VFQYRQHDYFQAEIRNLQLGERFDYEPEPSPRIRLIDEYDWLPTSADFEEALLAAGDDGCLPLMGRAAITSTPTPTSTPEDTQTDTPAIHHVPDMTVDASRQEFIDFLNSNGDCVYPCVWGFTVGRTSRDEFYQTVLSFPFGATNLNATDNLAQLSDEEKLALVEPGMIWLNWGASGGIQYRFQDNVLSKISVGFISTQEMNLEQLEQLGLENVVTNFEEKPEVWLTETSRWDHYDLTVVYPDSNVRFDYVFDLTQDDSEDETLASYCLDAGQIQSLEITAQTEGDIFVHNSDVYIPFQVAGQATDIESVLAYREQNEGECYPSDLASAEIPTSTSYPTWDATQQAELAEEITQFVQSSEDCQWPCIGQLQVGEYNQSYLRERFENIGFTIRLEETYERDEDGHIVDLYRSNNLSVGLAYDPNLILDGVTLTIFGDPEGIDFLLTDRNDNLSFLSILKATEETPQIYLTHGHPDRLSLRMVFSETGMHIDGTFDMEWDGENPDWVEGTPLCFGIDNMTYFRAEIRNLQLGERFDYEPEPSTRIRLIDEYDWLPTSADFEEALLAAGDDGCLPLMGRAAITSTPTPTSTPHTSALKV
jgi:hypothetical protein